MSRRSLEDLKYDLEHTKKENIATNLSNYLKLEKFECMCQTKKVEKR